MGMINLILSTSLICVLRICAPQMRCSFAMSSSQKCGWFYTILQHYKQTTGISSQEMYIFNWIVELSYVLCGGRALKIC